MPKSKPKVLFVYDYKFDNLWRDGLWAALKLLEEDFEIEYFNLHGANMPPVWSHDFLLAWGGFGSRPEEFARKSKEYAPEIKVGLCLGGYSLPTVSPKYTDLLFYETEWSKDWILENIPDSRSLNLMHAFGVNTDIYTPWDEAPIIWDYLSVGAFAYWKRHHLLLAKPGNKLVVGEIQKNNWQESFDIISDLLLAGVAISDMVYPTKLRNLYNCAGKVYIPADIMGGGERAVLEARACGRVVEVEEDNPKLKELLNCQIWDHKYYASQLKKGIELCLPKKS